MSDNILQAKDVSKVLGTGAGQVHAVKNADLALHGGELTLLMGPSGSGKTTLVSMLGCMLTPTAGTIEVCGRSTHGADAQELARLRRDHIGFIFQTYHLFPTLTAAENVTLALDVRGQRGSDARGKAHAALARVGLSHKLASYPNALSGGEQQRVAIARAIVSAPSAILADEPTAALDSENGQAVLGILAEIARDADRTVLVVTHDSRLVRFASRIVRIEDGRLVGEHREPIGVPELVPVAGDEH
jgi:putative ABC transport system ATP-binding protein